MMAGAAYSQSTGSTLLQPLSDLLDVPLDKVNFFACQFFALLAAFWFRSYLSPSQASSGVRHVFATILGVCIAIFCCGWYSIHLFVLVMISYGIMTMVSISNIHRYTFTVAMGYLTMCHITRIYIFGYGVVIATFCGPLMMATQKITTLAFQIRDGIDKKAEELTKEQNELVLRRKPSLLEYLSYQLNFLTVLAGPCSNYKDYMAFIEGRHVQMKLLEANWKRRDCDRLPDPSPVRAVLHKLCITLVWLIVFIILTKSFPMTYLVDDQFISEFSFLSKLGFLYLAVQALKAKHYFSWTLVDAVHNAAGYGFSGADEKGNIHWDLLTNLNIMNIEMATSFKMYLENWNIHTIAWLKRVCYNRVPQYRTALTFLLSAVWHGVYPGYYFTFITGIFMTLAARIIRKNYRHYFISPKPLKMSYDIATWLVTQLAVCYTVAPFVLLTVESTVKFYKSLYFYMHILCVLVFLIQLIRSSKHIKKLAAFLSRNK